MIKKEENKKEKKEIKKVVKKVVKKPSVKTTVAKKLPVIEKIVKKRDKLIVEEPIKKVVKKISKPVVKKLVKEVKKEEDKRIIEKPIIKERKKEMGILPIIKQKSDFEATTKSSPSLRDKVYKKYYQGIGRRKRAIASVRLFLQGDKIFTINNKPANIYFNNIEYQKIIHSSLEQVGVINKFKIQVLVQGGGLHAQAEAIRHGISRALLDFDKSEDFREKIKITGFLTRDSRRRERKKPGLKRARKATQWRKR